MKFDNAKALELLRLGTGNPKAEFREGQEEAIRAVVEGAGRQLVVQKTGWGKSFVYFIATKLLREGGLGPVLLISPLLSLMRNQLAAAAKMGLAAETINSTNPKDWATVEAKVKKNKVDIVLISPERLANEQFAENVLSEIGGTVSLLVIDEAHCISDWGHDFRPHYRLIERTAKNLPKNMRLLATTATANARVLDDLKQILGPNISVSRGDLNRGSLFLQTIKMPSAAERLAWLAEQLPKLKGSGIIYTLTKRDAERVAEWLQYRKLKVKAYTADVEDREELENQLIANEIKALVATTALGMGFDKPDLGFVIHYQMPGSVVAYYQQVGRAGRAIDAAYGVLFGGEEDSEIADFFIESAFPTKAEVDSVIKELEKNGGGLSVPDLLTRVNLNKSRVQKTLDLLGLESPAPIVKNGTKYQLTSSKLSDGFWERAKRLTSLRRDEEKQMEAYLSLQSGHMEFLIKALDGPAGAFKPPKLAPLPTSVDKATVLDAVNFLRRTRLPLEPRKKWPDGGMPTYGWKGNIKNSLQAQPGLALCYWQDAGWGVDVFVGKYKLERFSDELVYAFAKMVNESEFAGKAAWVTYIPSTKHPKQVPDLAKRLADLLKIPFVDSLKKIADRPEQKTMANSAQQARNVDGSLEVIGKLPAGPVLLVDDMANSRWTFAVAAYLLLEAGSGPVYPVALART
jgi:ATP-dependent DNA helicase RecQ